ncbi:MAG TPA: hypothetical protein ENK23_02610, partial [Sorangium sp.]|nr:hypothetical protein [Sorangium sp.]
MASRWFALLAASGACVGLALGGNACGGDDTSSPSGSTASSGGGSASGGSGGAGGAAGHGGAAQGGAGGGTGGFGGMGGMGPATDANCMPATGAQGGLKLTEVTTVPGSPLMVAAPAGDNDRLFILEQQGRIQLWKNNQLTVFLDISAKVLANGERGLLGMAFHPEYAQNGRFFVHYSNQSGNTVIAEYHRDPNNPDVADPNPVVEPILTVNQPEANHNGGSIEFSPSDGYLYIGLGDGGGANDVHGATGNGQNKNTLLAALLRLDVSDTSGNPPYAIPEVNITDGAPEIFDWGLRNPYRFSFDVCTGDRYIGDVGQNCFEEVDVAASTDGGQNWGWKIM